MFDIFYKGKKPNLFPFEKPADDLNDAALKSCTEFFWFINGNNDYSKFNFDIKLAPWQDKFIHTWASQWQRDGEIYLSRKSKSNQYHFRTDQTVIRKPDRENWIVPDYIDETTVDYTWHPNPLDPPYNYHFPSQWQSSSGVIYSVPGATTNKFIDTFIVKSKVTTERWIINSPVENFDYSWHPNALDEPYIYEFATQWHGEGGPIYKVPNATKYKYINEPYAILKSTTEHWSILHTIVNQSFDFSWAPHPKEDPYIYVWGNQHWPAEKMPTVEYRVPGATIYKYMEDIVKLDKNYSNWQIPEYIDTNSIDYTWVPDPHDEPYIYEFATQWQSNGGARYIVPGATKVKYVDIAHRRLPSKDNWVTIEHITDFDYSWHPSNTDSEYNYVFGNQHYSGTIMPTVKYIIPGATQEKFVDEPVAKLAESLDHWNILENIDTTQWDWTWRPNPLDPPYIYAFGNQWNPAEYKISITYAVPKASDIKYMEARTVRLPHPELFQNNFEIAEFDYSWEPNPFDPPYIYVFGNQWNVGVLEPTVIYAVESATEIKYIDNIIATIANCTTNWEIIDDIKEFDYSWRPNPTDPPYIYVFGNQWLTPEQRPALRYIVEGATEIKYIDYPKAQRIGNPELFITHYECNFDYSWEPDPGSPPYIYIFGNQHWPAEKMPTVEYRVPGASEIKYINDIHADILPTSDNWINITDIPFEFDYSWRPDPGDPDYIYVFSNQWYSGQEMPTVEYHMIGATERKFIDAPIAKLLPIMERWNIPEEIDSSNIDFSWVPHPKESAYIHHFGSEFQLSVGLTYTVPGATELKFEGEIPQIQSNLKTKLMVLDIFFIDKSNASATTRFDRIKEKYPNIQRVRYVNSIMDTVKRCVTRSKTGKFWIINSENIYDDFDFSWHAQPWQSYMTHVFGSQWQKWSDTFLINKHEFERISQWANSLEEFPNLNFVKDQTVYIPDDLHDIYFVDHGNEQNQLEKLKIKHPTIKITRYVEDYFNTFKRIMSTVTTEYVWIVSSLCQYEKFDFSWQPEPWQKEMIHVFPTQNEKRGHTFYIHVESFKKQLADLELLDWFNVINYCNEQNVPSLPIPVHVYTGDDIVNEIKNYEFKHPYTWFTKHNHDVEIVPSVWSAKDKKIFSISTANDYLLVPREVKGYLNTQLYDYPYIQKDHSISSSSIDIIYISNGEPDAERWYENLTNIVNNRPDITFKEIKRVQNVNGRDVALKQAAQLSESEWFFAVPAKLEVSSTFNWDWQPDYMQGPKHYIFHATNPLNGLEYGHMAIVAYNKRLVLETDDHGLDFTMSKAHAIVPLNSGIAHYNTNKLITWRTAFREVIKLKYDVDQFGSVESNYRLKIWLTKSHGINAEWSINGANDAVEYYNLVEGDYNQLINSFSWTWLDNHFNTLYMSST